MSGLATAAPNGQGCTIDRGLDQAPPPSQLPGLIAQKDPNLNLGETSSSNPYIVFNTVSPNENKAMQNVKVRQAVAMVLPYDKLFDNALYGRAIKLYGAPSLQVKSTAWPQPTGYRTDILGELALQGFYYGHIGMPSSFLISVFGTLRYARKFRKLHPFRTVHDGYRRGKQAAFLPTIKWEDWWTLPLSEVRRRVNIEPIAA